MQRRKVSKKKINEICYLLQDYSNPIELKDPEGFRNWLLKRIERREKKKKKQYKRKGK